MDESERAKLLAVHSIGPKMVSYFAATGFCRLADFAGQDAYAIALRIDVHLGAKRMNALGVAAIQNAIDLANNQVK